MASNSHTHKDVIIVGAGLTGLQAAVTVHQAGLSCLILEAKERIGGKVLSAAVASDSKVTVDLGPAWINDTNQSHMYALGQKYGAEFERQFVDGDHILEYENGKMIRLAADALPGTPEEQLRLLELVGHIDAVGEQLERENYVGQLSQKLDQVTFKEWVEKETDDLQAASAFMNYLTRALIGAEAVEVSALYMLKYVRAGTGFVNITGSGRDGGQYLRPHQGSQIYVNGLASELPSGTILTQHPVIAISQNQNQNGGGCTVTVTTIATNTNTNTTTAATTSSHHDHDHHRHTFTATKIIVTVPTPLYRHITFTPSLPPSKTALATETHMGYCSKVIAIYPSAWWRDANLTGEVQSLTGGDDDDDDNNNNNKNNGPISLVYDTSVPAQNQFSLTLFIASRSGRWTWSSLPTRAARIQAALDHLTRLFAPFVSASGGGDELPTPLNVLEQDWAKEPWIEGAPGSLYPLGLTSGEAGRALRDPVGHVHFAGTEMSSVWKGYMEGAVRDGERAANEVVAALVK